MKCLGIVLNKKRPSGYKNCCLDDPVYELRACDPRLVIYENVFIYLLPDYYEIIEVIVESEMQEEIVRKYSRLRGYMLIEFSDLKYPHNEKCDARPREVGHILFFGLAMTKKKHPELYIVEGGHFNIVTK